MAKTGPQKYPGASTAYWFGSRYEGAPMEINACVWHTTEGTTLPTYGGGASAPTITAVPDFDAQKLRWYQHFDIEQSARALVDAAGGITTNRNNLAQVELVGTCDPATHRKWQAADRQHIYWPEAPEWALREVAQFVRWLHANHGVPMTSTVTWRAYPGSYGTKAPQRLSSAAFNVYKGHLGHQHVPEGNDHGDPGDIDFARVIALAKGDTAPTQEVPVALTDDDIKKIGRQVVTGANGMKAPDDAAVDWALSSYVGLTYKATRRLEAELAAVKAAVASVSVGGVDLDALADKVADKLAARLAE